MSVERPQMGTPDDTERERETLKERLLNHVHRINKKEDKAVFTLGIHPRHTFGNAKTPACMLFFQKRGRRNYSECDLG